MDTADGPVPTVLIVEDDPVARRFYADALASSGYRVEQASNGSEALRSARTGLSAVVADLGLPDDPATKICIRGNGDADFINLAWPLNDATKPAFAMDPHDCSHPPLPAVQL